MLNKKIPRLAFMQCESCAQVLSVAVGLGDGPAHFIAATDDFMSKNPNLQEFEAPEYKMMDSVLSQLNDFGTLLLQWRQAKWHVALPPTAVNLIRHQLDIG